MAPASPESSQTLRGSSPIGDEKLDLSSLPPIYVSDTHFDLDDLHILEEKLSQHNAILTYDASEARIVLSKADKKRRAQFDLQRKGAWTAEVESVKDDQPQEAAFRVQKRVKVESSSAQDDLTAVVIDDSSTASESESSQRHANTASGKRSRRERQEPSGINERSDDVLLRRLTSDTVKVLKLGWIEATFRLGKLQPIELYLTFEGRPIPRPKEESVPSGDVKTSPKRPRPSFGIRAPKSPEAVRSILKRAEADAPKESHYQSPFKPRTHGKFSRLPGGKPSGPSHESNTRYAHLLHQTTSEFDSSNSSDLPDMPNWVKQDLKYACQRSTPVDNPNGPFIELLKQIRTARLLTNDEIGVRAYSTSIAAIAAYPYKLSSPREILGLPGCDVKIANLFVEYANTGELVAAKSASTNADLAVLHLFYNIWGVGALTAREFFYDRGWRELDDIVEYGWSTLSRVQQIGVKYYEEFLDPIPRAEVESIASIIHRHAVKVRDSDIQSLVVGGYRRGKDKCGDVDLIVSHPEEAQTANLVTDIVSSLEEEGWITHTLLLTLTTTHRDQQALPYRSSTEAGGGFDSLDKALVVWQDPHYTKSAGSSEATTKQKNPNIHRRVDIIIAPWRCVGCAVTGWSGGTTFQRDLRRYAKYSKGWKFDSSGIRERGTGRVVDVEGYEDKNTRAKTMVEAEKRVFESLGLAYQEPDQRCTG